MKSLFNIVKKSVTKNEHTTSPEARRRQFLDRKLGETAHAAANRQPDDIDKILADILSNPDFVDNVALNGVKASL